MRAAAALVAALALWPVGAMAAESESEAEAAAVAPAPVNYAPVFVAGAMLATFALRRFAPRLPKALLPWVAVALAVLGRIGAGGAVSLDLLLVGLGEGLAAGGLYSAAGKYVLRPARKVDEAAKATEGG